MTNWFAEIGWKTLSGRVIAIDQPYQVTRSKNWLLVVLSLLLVLSILPLIAAVIVAAYLSRPFFHFFPSLFESHGQAKTGIGSQLLNFFLYGSLFGPKKTHTVRDIRLRDNQAREHLVRIVGDLVAGNVNVGDEIEAFGWNKRGTLLLYRGRNLRTNSEILIKRQ